MRPADDNFKAVNEEYVKRIGQCRDQFEWMPQIAVGAVLFGPFTDAVQNSLNKADALLYKSKKAHKLQAPLSAEEIRTNLAQ